MLNAEWSEVRDAHRDEDGHEDDPTLMDKKVVEYFDTFWDTADEIRAEASRLLAALGIEAAR
ncbi:hypothetical protein BJP40_06505 [Streptomyces sp. CC53]|uniref:hypothetical protein n=1 Tax=Streptomyces sp. CC53 TaxID=1906740 RepID=UPI0008DDD6D1|nr:hypothetical protein [Streptomyces sp. CC53]OII61173.1 hypothetical protein BJP40_06505 [Streptomyces sp. CC53]